MPLLPYLISGTVYTVAGAFSASTTVTIMHDASGELQTTTTNALGQYLFDCANFTTYSEGDFVTVSVSSATSTSQDLRLWLVSRTVAQVSELKVKYTTD